MNSHDRQDKRGLVWSRRDERHITSPLLLLRVGGSDLLIRLF
jgi:hypothetical protein